MRRHSGGPVLLLLAAAQLAVVGCEASPRADAAPTMAVKDTRAMIVAAVTRRVLVDFGQSGAAPTEVVVVDRLGRAGAWGMVHFDADAPPLPKGTRAAIEAALAHTKVSWSTEPMSEADVGAVEAVMIAEPRVVDGVPLLTVELSCGPRCGVGSTFRMEHGAKGWHTAGTSGAGFVG